MYNSLIDELKPYNARLVAVSKLKSAKEILNIYNQGHRIFGENRAQELSSKKETLPADIEWHMIGHLQRNKVKYIASFVSMIQSVHSFSLLKEVNKQALKHNRTIPVLLEFKIAQEETKSGFTSEDCAGMFEDVEFNALKGVSIQGVMGMATFTSEPDQIRSEFRSLKSIFDHLKETYFKDKEDFKEISMGMSGDYKIALEEGATIVRIGSLLFGPRL